MKKIVKIEQLDPTITHITWIINNICPNTCSYCPVSTRNGANHNYDWKYAREFVKILLTKYPKIHLSIAGGEPSMSPHLIELIKLFSDQGHYITLTTNGYKSVEYWQELSHYVSWIGFSYHPEFSTEQYFANLEAASAITNCTARVMMLSNQWDRCLAVYNKLNSSSRYSTSPVRIVEWGRYNGTDYYTPEQLDWFAEVNTIDKDLKHHKLKPAVPNKCTYYFEDGTKNIGGNPIHYVNQGQTNFKGYSCDIGLRSLWIGAHGEIKRGNCMAGGYIGNVNKPFDIVWPDSPIICPHNLCHCSTDVVIDKQHTNISDYDIFQQSNKQTATFDFRKI